MSYRKAKYLVVLYDWGGGAHARIDSTHGMWETPEAARAFADSVEARVPHLLGEVVSLGSKLIGETVKPYTKRNERLAAPVIANPRTPTPEQRE